MFDCSWFWANEPTSIFLVNAIGQWENNALSQLLLGDGDRSFGEIFCSQGLLDLAPTMTDGEACNYRG